MKLAFLIPTITIMQKMTPVSPFSEPPLPLIIFIQPLSGTTDCSIDAGLYRRAGIQSLSLLFHISFFCEKADSVSVEIATLSILSAVHRYAD